MKKTFEIKGVDLTSLYGVGDKNIIFLEKIIGAISGLPQGP